MAGPSYDGVMSGQFTNAEEMALRAGLPNGKTFRSRVRKRLSKEHTRGSWKVEIGGRKHLLMKAELAAMLAEKANA